MNFLTGVKVLELDVPNKNNRMYAKGTIQKALENAALRGGELYGTFANDYTGAALDLYNVSHVASNLKIVDGYLQCDIKILDTPKGQQLQQILEAGSEVAYRSAGIGEIRTLEDGTVEVTDFELVSVSVMPSDEAA